MLRALALLAFACPVLAHAQDALPAAPACEPGGALRVVDGRLYCPVGPPVTYRLVGSYDGRYGAPIAQPGPPAAIHAPIDAVGH